MSDELERNHPASDEGEEETEDVDAHRNHPMTDEDDSNDDVEAHRAHSGG